MTVDKGELLKSRLRGAEEVEVPGVGPVLVRGLSRAEVLAITSADTSEPGSFERKMLAFAMVGPELTEDEVGIWQKGNVSGELQPVVDKVNELSALTRDAAKRKYKEFESDPDLEFRVSPGGDTA